MKSLVICDSQYGNTRLLAEAIAAYLFRGSTASHLNGQGCDLVDPDDAEPDVQAVRFSCGCVGRASCHRWMPANQPRLEELQD
jgi:hypothetical protein